MSTLLSNPMDPIEFESLDIIEIPVTLAGQQYVLREADGNAATVYKSAVVRSIRMVDGKTSGISGELPAADLALLASCLFLVSEKGKVPVAQKLIASWPGRVSKALAERCKTISELNPVETKESLTKQLEQIKEKLAKLEGPSLPKDEQNDTTSGSS